MRVSPDHSSEPGCSAASDRIRGQTLRMISTLTRGSSLKRNSYSGFVINVRAEAPKADRTIPAAPAIPVRRILRSP